MRNRHYLSLMGIDVWQKRRPRAATVVSADEASEPLQTTAVSQTASVGIADVKRSLGVVPQSDSRQNHPEISVVERAEKTESKLTPEPQPANATTNATANEPAPEFLLTFSHFGTLTMVNYYPVDFASIPGNHQRFLATLNRALSRQKEVAQMAEFRWPMVKSSRISQSKTEAQQVMSRNLEQCRSNVLIFGADATEMLGADVIQAKEEGGAREGVVRDRFVTVVSEIELYFRTPSHRRELWRDVRSLRDRCLSVQ